MNKSTNASSGISFGGALFLIFLTLKLTGLVDWSWWWVTAPIWGSWLVAIAIIGAVVIFDYVTGGKR